MESNTIALVGITLLAATVNGALGYGFSSITVPVALLFLTNRVLNPALVPIELVLNAYVLSVTRRSELARRSVRLRRPVFARQHGAHPTDSSEPCHRRSGRRAAHSAHPARDVPPRLYELRRVGCRLRIVRPSAHDALC